MLKFLDDNLVGIGFFIIIFTVICASYFGDKEENYNAFCYNAGGIQSYEKKVDVRVIEGRSPIVINKVTIICKNGETFHKEES